MEYTEWVVTEITTIWRMDVERKTLSLPHCTDFPSNTGKFSSTLDGFLFCTGTRLIVSQNHQGQNCRPNGAYHPPARHWFSLELWPECSNHPVSCVIREWSLLKLPSQHLCKPGHPSLDSLRGREPVESFKIAFLTSETLMLNFHATSGSLSGVQSIFITSWALKGCFATCALRKQ